VPTWRIPCFDLNSLFLLRGGEGMVEDNQICILRLIILLCTKQIINRKSKGRLLLKIKKESEEFLLSGI